MMVVSTAAVVEDGGSVAPVSIAPGGGSVGTPLEEQAAQTAASKPTSMQHRQHMPLQHLTG
jgi:hypothetical protein